MDASYEMLKDIVLIQKAMIDSLDQEVCRLEDALEYGPMHGENSSEEFDAAVVELTGKFEKKYNVKYFSAISAMNLLDDVRKDYDELVRSVKQDAD